MGSDKSLHMCLEVLERLGEERARGAPLSPESAREAALALWGSDCAEAAEALISPHFPLTMLWRTLGQGFRGNPQHPRPRDEDGDRLAVDLLAFVRLHSRIVAALPGLVDWPPAGLPASELSGDGGWCDLCGQCCCLGGTVPTPPEPIRYPAFFYHAISGETLFPQPFCPFLFQALNQPLFYCGLHPIKPLACRRFGHPDCERGRTGRGFKKPAMVKPRATLL